MTGVSQGKPVLNHGSFTQSIVAFTILSLRRCLSRHCGAFRVSHLFHTILSGGAYPDIVGRLVDEDSSELMQPTFTKDNTLFKKLDDYLKKNKV